MASTDHLERALSALAGVASVEDAQTVAALRTRLVAPRLRVLVAGEAKRGKSTLINQLLERELLPTGVTPVTAIATTVRSARGDPECIVVTGLDGQQRQLPLEQLATHVTERANPGNVRGVREVEVRVNAPLLDRHPVEFVDTPGTGSVFAHNTAATESVLASLDAAIFVVTADPPISATERDLLARVSEFSVHTVVVLNKADQLDAAELREAQEFTEQVCLDATGHRLPVYACSARASTVDPGYRCFADGLTEFLKQRATSALAEALGGHLVRAASAMLDSALLTDRALTLAESAAGERVTLFRNRLAELCDRVSSLDDQSWAAERRLRAALDHAAAEQVAELIERCADATRAELDAALRDLGAAALEGQGRELVDRIIGDAVERWRTEQAQVLELGLGMITSRAIEYLQNQLADLRDAARDLLGVELSIRDVVQPLRPSARFWYDFDRGIGVEAPLAGVARAILPGRIARVRARLLQEIPQLVDRQIGRARSDLAGRLRESVRETVAQLRAEHARVLDRIRTALDQAGALSQDATDTRQLRRGELTHRITVLRGVLAEL